MKKHELNNKWDWKLKKITIGLKYVIFSNNLKYYSSTFFDTKYIFLFIC